MNTGAPLPGLNEARKRVLEIQTKLHRWATDDLARRFDDLHNLVCDPAFLVVAWSRVRGNAGARTAGVDGVTPRSVGGDEERLLTELRGDLKARTCRPVAVRERMIPKRNGALRALGIPTARDRTVQAALKLVLEPIFEADFKPCSHGFRPNRRAQDAIAEIHFFASRSYEWVVDADIEACFDTIDHPALMARAQRRVGDKRVLALVKAFLKAGVLSEDGVERDTTTGTPQGGILSPLLANVALSAIDEHFIDRWQAMGDSSARARRRRRGEATWRLVRYADDFVALVARPRHHAEALRAEIAQVLAPLGLHLSSAKTRIAHIDEGFEFLGFRIQRQAKKGTTKQCVYTWPSKSALAAVKRKVRDATRGATNQSLAVLCYRLAPVLRGWANYFRHGVSKRTFDYLRYFTWQRVVCWLRHKHPYASWSWLRRRYLPGWWPTDAGVELFDLNTVAVTRYRWRADNIPSPWATAA